MIVIEDKDSSNYSTHSETKPVSPLDYCFSFKTAGFKLLLDECVKAKIEERFDYFRGSISTSVTILGPGTKDEKIREFAKISGHVIVTRDWGMIRECLEQNINTALYFRGKAYLVRLDNVFDLTENETEPVFSNKIKKMRRFQALTVSGYEYAHP